MSMLKKIKNAPTVNQEAGEVGFGRSSHHKNIHTTIYNCVKRQKFCRLRLLLLGCFDLYDRSYIQSFDTVFLIIQIFALVFKMK